MCTETRWPNILWKCLLDLKKNDPNRFYPREYLEESTGMPSKYAIQILNRWRIEGLVETFTAKDRRRHWRAR